MRSIAETVGSGFYKSAKDKPKLVVNAFSSPVQCPSLHIIVPERVRVAVRLWPRNAEETVVDADFADCVELQTELKRLKLRKNNWNSDTYEFDEVFTEFVSQKRVYEVVAKPVVEQQQQQWQRPWRRAKIKWPISLLREDGKLLLVNEVQADVVVVADGTGNFTKIMDAVLAAEDYSTKRFVIYIKRDLFASLVWNVAGYVAGIRVLLEDGGLLGMGWSVAECLHWSSGVWLLEYSHWKRALLLEVKLKVLLLEYFH
ncbi:hypothetical protein CUMW_217100 [Citrus unshiu]|nr:hypothetical protein CUMW_217100 [Citrus unshiu]